MANCARLIGLIEMTAYDGWLNLVVWCLPVKALLYTNSTYSWIEWLQSILIDPPAASWMSFVGWLRIGFLSLLGVTFAVD